MINQNKDDPDKIMKRERLNSFQKYQNPLYELPEVKLTKDFSSIITTIKDIVIKDTSLKKKITKFTTNSLSVI